MDALLGTMSDQDLAVKLGCKRAHVSGRRYLLRIPKYSHSIIPENEFEWTPASDALLGTMVDQDIAEKLGCTVAAIRNRRHLLEIPRCRNTISAANKVEWTPALDALLGTIPDSDLAKMMGCSRASVYTRRRQLGIPRSIQSLTPVNKFVWTSEIDAQIGTIADQQLAEKLGVTRNTVGKRRRLLGIAAKVEPLTSIWTPELDALFSTTSNMEIARRLGISSTTVQLRRKVLNIAPYVKTEKGSQDFQWTQEKDTLLGTASDTKLAALWGVSRGVVRSRRIQKNIPAYKPTSRWTPEMVALLGTMSDAEIARKMGIDIQSVREHRWGLRIPINNSIVWTSDMEALLGTMSDKHLAHKLGLFTSTVRTRRKMLDIPAFGTRRKMS